MAPAAVIPYTPNVVRIGAQELSAILFWEARVRRG
jgi:hypothetical protein